MMTLKDILSNIKTLEITGRTDVNVKGVEIDSRKVDNDFMFVAMRGTLTDGHRFIEKAVEKGASVVVCEELPYALAEDVTYVKVSSTQDVVGRIATVFYEKPSTKLKLIGVTGTNGKTTIATLLYNMYRAMGHRCGLLSTVCNYIDGNALPADHTTPDAISLNRLLSQMVDAGCEYVFMECSSHAIDQQRIGGLTFAAGIFTNLTRDHLDYHHTFDAYRDAKKKFFDMLGKDSFAIINADDKNGLFMVQNTKAQVKTYSIRQMADFRARLLECYFEGMYLEIDGREVGVQFIGRFNVSNLLAVYATAVCLGKSKDDVLLVMSQLKSVSGRLQPVHSSNGITAIVDYAHTPDALSNVLTAINEVVESRSRGNAERSQIITVCGAGGNRDKGKRPLMAQEAVRQSSKVIITSDNPRNEDPQEIINDMLEGLTPQQRKKTLSIVDRREAIRTAVMLSKKGDVILIAGKGHEDYQEIAGIKHHFDDCEVVREIFDEQ